MSTTRARTRHLVSTSVVAVVALLGATLSACSSAEDPDEGATSSASPSREPSESSAGPTDGWHTAADEGGQFLVPPDWNVEKVATGHNLQAPVEGEGGFRLGGGILTSRPTLESATAIDDAAAARVAYDKKAGYDKVTRLPDLTFGGLTFYHVRAEDPETWIDDYGTVSDGQRVTILWQFKRELVDRKQTDELINQVMPTFEPSS
ncbi:hypothetical protein [Nocardioides sp.]|uniref:hypothetical protein n=1 Tax=Nocardioides sp. TaxID=35761 RepID=UPI0019A4F846|nr:hypothetical protein [Nocardioides sp.]MBC7279171.1 hypothetical protein [Nocardioides sp.]